METTHVDIDNFLEALKNHSDYFIQMMGTANWRDGWKLSIQGKTLEDSKFLFENLIGFLHYSRASYKFGTQKLIDLKHPQQSTKLLTIYIPNGVEVKSFAELVRLNLIGYKGAEGIDTPESYEPYSKELGIYFRNDRDEFGMYIPAN